MSHRVEETSFCRMIDISTSQNKPASARRVENLKWPAAECNWANFENSAVSYNSIRKSTSRKMHFIMRYFLQSSFVKARGWYLFLFRNILQLLLFQALCRLEWMEEGKWFEQAFFHAITSRHFFHYEQHLWKLTRSTFSNWSIPERARQRTRTARTARTRLGCGRLRQLHADQQCGDQLPMPRRP